MRLYPNSKGGGAYFPGCAYQIGKNSVGVAYFALRRRVPKTFGALAKMEHYVSSVIQALLDRE